MYPHWASQGLTNRTELAMSNTIDHIIWASPQLESATFFKDLQTVIAAQKPSLNVQVYHDKSALDEALSKDKTARLCLFYNAPEYSVSDAIHKGKDSALVLDEWARSARETLTLQRQNRRRSLLFEVAHLRPTKMTTGGSPLTSNGKTN